MNVTGGTADLAVELVGDGRNTTFPVPEHGTVMPVGIFFGTKKLVKPARIVVVAAGTRAALIFFPALPGEREVEGRGWAVRSPVPPRRSARATACHDDNAPDRLPVPSRVRQEDDLLSVRETQR